MTVNAFSVPADRTDELPAACIGSCAADVSCGAAPQQAVSAVRRDRLTRQELHALSDADLDGYIRLCIERQNQGQARWIADGCLAGAGERDRWMLAEHEARDHRTVRRELRRSRA